MKKRNFLLLMTAFVFVLMACQKEKSQENGIDPGGTPPTDTLPNPADSTSDSTHTEVGTWKFISVQGTAGQTAAFTQAGNAIKAVSVSNFTSENNAGTVTFDSSTMTATGIALSVNTTATTYFYQNGTLADTLNSPLNQTVPPQNATSGYTKIGTDSLDFQNGGFLDVLTGGLLPSAPSGCKVSFTGNTMKMKIVYDTVTTQDYQGVPANITLHTELVVTLQKN